METFVLLAVILIALYCLRRSIWAYAQPTIAKTAGLLLLLVICWAYYSSETARVILEPLFNLAQSLIDGVFRLMAETNSKASH
jgi:hypothetical protein